MSEQKKIRVTIWNEYVQESGEFRDEFHPGMPEKEKEGFKRFVEKSARQIKEIYPAGVMGTVAEYLQNCPDMQVTSVNMYMSEYGLTDELLENTDVLIWWGHTAHDAVPDELAAKVRDRVLKGMGFLPLHSAHLSKPMKMLLGTSCSLRWRHDDICRVWNVNPGHPIAQGIPEYFELEEEMYGEFFDIPQPDELIFLSWYKGGEVFRGGCTWTRGYGRMFYFHPGHETNPTYHNAYVMRIIENGVRWVAPTIWRQDFSCPHVVESPESKRVSK